MEAYELIVCEQNSITFSLYIVNVATGWKSEYKCIGPCLQ